MENQNKEILENEKVEETEVVEENAEVEEENAEAVEEVNETAVVESEEQPQEETKVVEEEYVGKEVTTSIRYDYRTMKYYNMYNSVVHSKVQILSLVAGFISLGFVIYLVIEEILRSQKPDAGSTPFITYLCIGLCLFFACRFFYQVIRFEAYVDKTITNHFLTHKVSEQHIRIREDKITLIPVNKPEESFSYDWVQVTSIEEIEEFFFLYIGRSPLIIEKDPAKIVDGTIEQLNEIIDEKVAVKPYKKYTKKLFKNPITYVHQEDLENDENAIEVETVEEQTEEQND